MSKKRLVAFFLVFSFAFTLCAAAAPWAQPGGRLTSVKPHKAKANNIKSILSSRANKNFKDLIRLRSYQFDPSSGEPPISDDLKIAKYRKDERGFYIVQFKGPVKEAWKEKIRQLGVKLYPYIPNNAFIVKMDPEQKAQVAKLSEVRW